MLIKSNKKHKNQVFIFIFVKSERCLFKHAKNDRKRNVMALVVHLWYLLRF